MIPDRFILCVLAATMAQGAAVAASPIVDRSTGTVITAPDGIVVAAGSEIPEWRFTPAPSAAGWPPLARDERVLCALRLSSSPRFGDRMDPDYLKRVVEDKMRSQGAGDPPPVVERSGGQFTMTSLWRPTSGPDAGKAIFMFHAETGSAYAYMSCATRVDAAAAAAPMFRRIWRGVQLPR